MSLFSKIFEPQRVLRRCQPWLGTYVEIQVWDATDLAEETGTANLERAVGQAFSKIKKVHRCMSVHDAGSELSRWNAAMAGSWVEVGPELMEVVEGALGYSEESEGWFDPMVGGVLMKLGMRPRHPGMDLCENENGGGWRSLEVDTRGRKVRRNCRGCVDLGGIAKGYAVDLAVEALKSSGVRGGMVNAGGDLRVWGGEGMSISIRAGGGAGGVVESVTVVSGDEAIATSSGLSGMEHERFAPHIYDMRRKMFCGEDRVATVRANTAMEADVLAKLVLMGYPGADRMLERRGAEAWLVEHPFSEGV